MTPTAVPTIQAMGEGPLTIIPSVVPPCVVVVVVIVWAAREQSKINMIQRQIPMIHI